MRHREKGFTLIEVMVVIIMLGVLAAVSIPIYSGYVHRARAVEGISMLGAIKTYAIEYRTSKGTWPTDEIISETFYGFKDLFYFDREITVYELGDRFAVQITADSDFGLPSSIIDQWIQLDFAIANVDGKYLGWSGDIVKQYADYLPRCEEPLS